jgi:hypothetical protein
MSQNMLLISSVWERTPEMKLPTFKLIPASLDCPYTEAIFDPFSGYLVVLDKNKKTSFQMVPRLDDNGDRMVNKKDNSVKQERRLVDIFNDHIMYNPEEIESFIERFAVNAHNFDYKKYFKMSEDLNKQALQEEKVAETVE